VVDVGDDGDIAEQRIGDHLWAQNL
jgi:hypothetical protein